jgi:hypothetical protein
MPEDDAALYQLLLDQARELRQLKLELEALKRMFFEHRPPFIEAFAQQAGAVEGSGFLRPMDEMIRRLEHPGKAR